MMLGKGWRRFLRLYAPSFIARRVPHPLVKLTGDAAKHATKILERRSPAQWRGSEGRQGNHSVP
jgi:hypothetical protein